MANEVLTSNLERANAVLDARFLLLLADRAIIGAHPAIFDAGDVASINNNVIKVRRLGLDGYDIMATATEIQDLANVAFTDASTNVTVGRYSLSYDASTLAVGTDSVLGLDRFASSLLMSAMVTETSLLASLATGFSNSSGSVSAEMSLTTFLAALAALEARNVPGPYMFLGHSAHRRGLRLEQLLSVGGQTQYQPPTGVAVGSTFGGRLFDVDTFYTNRAPDSSTGKAGMMVGTGAILRGYLSPPVEDPSRQTAVQNILIEYARDAGATISQYHGHLFVGYAENDDDRGQQILCKS